jgi:hypothetical protein
MGFDIVRLQTQPGLHGLQGHGVFVGLEKRPGEQPVGLHRAGVRLHQRLQHGARLGVPAGLQQAGGGLQHRKGWRGR